MIKAEIIADSKNEFGNRITTMIVTIPRIILAEFNTHRMFSRNSASSRAIPFEKMVKSVKENPFIPIAWQKDHKGMQGTEYLTDRKHENAVYEWLKARDYAVNQASMMNNDGVTKQLCNRLLEPFMWTTMLITGSKEGWDNFFNLRLPKYHLENIPTINEDLSLSSKTLTLIGKSKSELLKQINEIDNDSYTVFKTIINNYSDLDWLKLNKGKAEIHMMALAEAMWDAYNESTPKELKAGEWHIPFGDNFFSLSNSFKVKVATARCARVSYTVVGEEGKEANYENDIKLHDRLAESGHWSPFEHCAKAMNEEEWVNYINGIQSHRTTGITNDIMGWSGNFRGFIQYRKMFDNENIK